MTHLATVMSSECNNNATPQNAPVQEARVLEQLFSPPNLHIRIFLKTTLIHSTSDTSTPEAF